MNEQITVAKKLSVIVPVYYNEGSLLALYERLMEVEKQISAKSGHTLELIFVDDGSRDSSFDKLMEIKKLRPDTKVIRLAKNFGEMAATGRGFHFATGECITVLAADLQDPPEQIVPMFEEWLKGEKLVYSCRQSRQDPFLTKLFAGLYYKILGMFVVKDFPKGGADMILLDRALLPYLTSLPQSINYVLYLFWLGFKPKILLYDRVKREHGKSRWNFKKKFFYFLDNITGFSTTPLRLISGFGLTVSILGFVYGLVLVISALIKGVDVPGFTTLACLISFCTGITLAMLSIISEYVWRIFEIVSIHPKSVVAETFTERRDGV